MEIEWRLLLPLLAVLALTILLTGPGLWSDKWGYWWMNKAKRPRDRHPGAKRRQS